MKKHKNGAPTYSDLFLKISLIILYIFASVPLRLIYRPNIISNHDAFSQIKQGTLIVSNHQSRVDPFIILMSMPLRTWLRILPVRFPTSHEVFTNKNYNPSFFPVLKFWGCFSIGSTSEEKMRAVFYIRDLLKKRKTLMLFPEGRINKDTNIGDIMGGITLSAPHASSILFVRLRGFNNPMWSTSKRSITYGEVIHSPKNLSKDDILKLINEPFVRP